VAADAIEEGREETPFPADPGRRPRGLHHGSPDIALPLVVLPEYLFPALSGRFLQVGLLRHLSLNGIWLGAFSSPNTLATIKHELEIRSTK
jgi:hypothetical protein